MSIINIIDVTTLRNKWCMGASVSNKSTLLKHYICKHISFYLTDIKKHDLFRDHERDVYLPDSN